MQYCRQRLDDLAVAEQALVPYEDLEAELIELRMDHENLVLRNEYLVALQQICTDDNTAYRRCRVLEQYRIELELFLGRHDEIVSEKNLVALYASLVQVGASLIRYQDFAIMLRDLLVECKEILDGFSLASVLGSCVVELRDDGFRLEALRVAASIEIPFRALFSLREELSELANIVVILSTVVPDTLPVHQALEEYRTVSYEFSEISNTLSAIRFCETEAMTAENQLVQEKHDFDDISGGICPLCGQHTGGHVHE